MEQLQIEDDYESKFVGSLLDTGEVIVPYFEAETFVESIDKTRTYIIELIEKYDLRKIGTQYTVSGGRYTVEHGHHYWVRMWNPIGDE